MSKRFAIVYDKDTKEILRLIDTSDDRDDSHLLRARAVTAPNEVMEAFPISDHAQRFPRFMVQYIGTGEIL